MFELRYPPGWAVFEGGIDYAGTYQFGPFKLVVFSTAPLESQDGPMLSVPETYRRFKDAYAQAGQTKQLQIGTLTFEVIAYEVSGDNGIYGGIEDPGTLALWQTKCGFSSGVCNFALFDEHNTHQIDGVFETMLESFRLIDE